MLRLPTLRGVSAAAIIFACACASSSGSSPAGATQAGATQSAPVRDRTQITAADMQGVAANNLYEVVQRLHPEWLAHRTTPSSGRQRNAAQNSDSDISVYVGDQRAGNSEYLKNMSVGSVAALKYYSAGDAQAKFGTGNSSGVIQIVSSR